MPDPKAPEQEPEPIDADDLVYETPAELLIDGDRGEPRRSSVAVKLAALVVVALVVGAALLAYRAHQRNKVVAAALSQADSLLRLDTAAGYRQAAVLLDPIAQLDPMQAASVRAFALAMLFADYREADLEAEVENLLVTPGRAESVPPYAQLAAAALALGHKEAGTATTAATRAGDGPWPNAMQARIALLAGNVEAALPAATAAAEGAFPAGLALHGDTLRRLRRDLSAARTAYEAALSASPVHPRAAYGLAKLALSGTVPLEEAEIPLQRLLHDEGTPSPERGRAALHLAALRIRAGDRAGANAVLDGIGLAPGARTWASQAALVAAEQRGPYRAVSDAPTSLQSANDDDPGELSPTPPPPPQPPARKPHVSKGPASHKQAQLRRSSVKKAATHPASKGSKKLPRKKARRW